MLTSQITAALAQSRTEDFRRERIERTAPTRGPVRVRAHRLGPSRRTRARIGLRAIRA
ncbi:MAG: hypothetical protein ACXVSL_17180 [Solirubrobacteraceae bacterium]